MKKILFLISLLLLVLISCEPEVQINADAGDQNPPKFSVNFDGETFYADVAIAHINNGVITIIADKHDTVERIIITLNSDIIGSYSFTPNASIGEITYKKGFESTFFTKANTLSGRVDIATIDVALKKLTGDFSLVGSRYIQQFDILGNPIINSNSELVFVEETKIFTNGLFENIDYTLDPPIFPTQNNQFSVKLDHTNDGVDNGTEYIEDEIYAHKTTIAGNSYILIKAKKTGFESITFKIPGNTIANTFEIDDVFVTGTEFIGNYTIDAVNFYSTVNQTTDGLIIDSHNQIQNKIKGRFNFDAIHSVTGDLLHMYDGAFEIVYTEE